MKKSEVIKNARESVNFVGKGILLKPARIVADIKNPIAAPNAGIRYLLFCTFS